MSFLNGSQVDTPLAPSASTIQTSLPDWYTNYAMQIIANQNQQLATPYSTFQGPRVAGLTPDQQRAIELTRQVARPEGLQTVEGMIEGAAGMSAAGAASPWLSQAGSMSGVDAAHPSLRTGAGYLASSTNPTGIAMASPFLAGASARSIDDVDDYMGPYTDAVVDRIATLGNRNFTENLLPTINDQFVGAGGYGGSRHAEIIGRSLRDTQEGITAQQDIALDRGYTGALSASAADKARQAALAGTAGGLGTEQQRTLAAAGQGSTQIGQIEGALTVDQQRILAGIGSTTGELTSRDAQTRLQAAQQMAAVQQQRQDMGIKGASALEGAGALQRSVEQQSYDLAFTDFMRQQGYDQTQIDAAVKTLGGVQPAVPKATLQEGYGPVQPAGSNPSGLQTLAGTAAAILPFLKL